MWEVVRAIGTLRDPARLGGLHLPWLRSLRGRLGGIDLRAALTLAAPSGYTPDFMTPPPTTPLTEFADELAILRGTPAAQIREDIERVLRDRPRVQGIDEFLAAPRRATAKLADAVEAFWELALAPHWPRIRALLEADLHHRALKLTEGGLAPLFADLHPTVRWDGEVLHCEKPFTTEVELAGRGIVLVPSVFVWERTSTVTAPPWQPALVYPARGIGLLWEPVGERTPEAVGRLVGRSRAQLLTALDAPRTTTEVARALGLTPGGASQHLTVLKEAGLLASRREGRAVLYARTPLADALLGR